MSVKEPMGPGFRPEPGNIVLFPSGRAIKVEKVVKMATGEQITYARQIEVVPNSTRPGYLNRVWRALTNRE